MAKRNNFTRVFSDQKVIFSLKSHPCDASPPIKCESCTTYFHMTTFPDGYTTQKMLLKWKKGFDQSKVRYVTCYFRWAKNDFLRLIFGKSNPIRDSTRFNSMILQ